MHYSGDESKRGDESPHSERCCLDAALEKSRFCGANKEEIRRLLKQAGAVR